MGEIDEWMRAQRVNQWADELVNQRDLALASVKHAAFEVTPSEWTEACELAGYGTTRPSMGYAHLNQVLAKRPAADRSYTTTITDYTRIIVNGVSMTYPEAFEHARKDTADLCQRYATQIRNLEKRAKRAEDREGKARCERDEALEARLNASTASDATIVDLRETLRLVKEERDKWFQACVNGDDLDRELKAERAAHEKTQQAMGDWQRGAEAERRLKIEQRVRAEAAEKRVAELERELGEARAPVAASSGDDFDVAESDVFDACMTLRHDFGLLPEADYERGVLVYDMRKILHQFAERQRARFRRRESLQRPAEPKPGDAHPEPSFKAGDKVIVNPVQRDGIACVKLEKAQRDKGYLTVEALNPLGQLLLRETDGAHNAYRFLPAAEPKPGDVLSGEEAKAWMLANPGRKVYFELSDDLVYASKDGVILKLFDGEPSVDFEEGTHKARRYVVLPPEPAQGGAEPVKPATPKVEAGALEGVRDAIVVLATALKYSGGLGLRDRDAVQAVLDKFQRGGSDV